MSDAPVSDLDVAIAHLYGAAMQLMQKYSIPFVPLDVIREAADWSDEELGAMVDACIEGEPVVLGGLVADWIYDGERPAFGVHGAKLIGIRPR